MPNHKEQEGIDEDAPTRFGRRTFLKTGTIAAGLALAGVVGLASAARAQTEDSELPSETVVASVPETERDPATIKFSDILALMDVSPEITNQYFQPFLVVNIGDNLNLEDVNGLKTFPNFDKPHLSMQGTELFYNSVPGYESREFRDKDVIYADGFNQGIVYQIRATVFPIPGSSRNLAVADILNLGVKETAIRAYKNGAVTHVFAKENQGFAATCLPPEQDPNNTVIKVEFFADPNWGYPVTSYDQQWWWWNDNGKEINEF